MIQPLPPVEKPRHEQGPRPCSACQLSYEDDRLRCRKFGGTLCTFARHESGSCGPDGLYWTERAK